LFGFHGKADMSHAAYAEFSRLIGYQVLETSHGIWIGPSHGFFTRVPLYETAPPTKDELRTLFRRRPTLGVNYAAEPGTPGKVSCVYFIRHRNYDLMTLDSKGRWSVKKGMQNCQVRPMSFDELEGLAMPLNLETLARQGRDDPIFSDEELWARLCQAGKRVEGVQAWGAFVGDELGAYLVLIQVGAVVNLLYSNSRTSLSKLHPVSALFFTVIRKMMRTPGVEAVYNGAEWLTAANEGLDRFKRRLGFEREPVVFVFKLRSVARHVLLNRGVRRVISGLGYWLPDNDHYQRVQMVLDIASLSLSS
jgi:hypothetical protein